MSPVYHALVLNLHQPAGNLEFLLQHNEWEAREILYALDRIPRSLWGYEDIARVHLSLSGTLLETLRSSEFQQRVYGIVKCGDLLWQLQNLALFRILGTGYYHPVFPLTPVADWEEHLVRWISQARHLLGRPRFAGFWPPEMGFCMEMIPLLRRLGYRYVIVDSEHIEPVTPMRWEEIRYRPHVARFEGEEITVVVRDRELSNAQEAGMDVGWFLWETHERTRQCDFPPLITTATDGENGGWFRNVSEKGNFWGVCYVPLLEKVRRNETDLRPAFIEDYLDQHGAHGEVRVRSGAWNTGWHHGIGFQQWTGSQTQREALQRVADTSRALHELRRRAGERAANDVQWLNQFEQAHWRLLRAETSCNFFWGEDWVTRCHRDLDEAWLHLNAAKQSLPKD
jgi:4-alpha-glucanotransferase